MQKKVFLQRGQKSGGGRTPYVKYLLWAALGLVLLVIVTPYLLSPKGKDNGRKLVPEKGALKKELPKPPEPAPGELPPSEKFPGGLAAKPEPAPEPLKPPEPAPAQPEPVPAPQPIQPQEPPQVAKPAEPAPKDLFPKSPSAPAPAVTQKTPPAAREKKEPSQPAQAGAPALGMKPSQPAAKAGQGYSVQVGCYKEKQNAVDIKNKLQKKGYDVMLRPSRGNANCAYSVVTKPVPSMSKAATLAEQIKVEQKVNPIIIKASAAGDLDDAALKAAMKKPLPTPVSKPVVKKTTAPAANNPATKPAAAPAKPKATSAAKTPTTTPARGVAAQ